MEIKYVQPYPDYLYSYDRFNDEIYKFNLTAGSLDKITKASLDLQIKLIEEEIKELREAFELNDPSQVLAEYTDVIVTSMGLGQMLNKLGLDVMGACKETGRNNLTKFIPNNEAGKNEVINTLDFYDAQDIYIRVTVNPETNLYVFKDKNGKVRKPSNYVPKNIKVNATKLEDLTNE